MGNYVSTKLLTEVKILHYLAWYSIFVNIIENSFWLSDVVFLGHLGKGHLAAAIIAKSYYNIMWIFLEGVLTAQDTLLSKANCHNDESSAKYWSYIAFLIVTVLNLINTGLIFASNQIIGNLFFVRPHLAGKAAEYLLWLLPALWCQGYYRTIQKYLQCKSYFSSCILCGVIGSILNTIGNYLLIFQLNIGFAGCGIASSIAYFIVLILSFYFLIKSNNDEEENKESLSLIKSHLAQIFNFQQHFKFDRVGVKTSSSIEMMNRNSSTTSETDDVIYEQEDELDVEDQSKNDDKKPLLSTHHNTAASGTSKKFMVNLTKFLLIGIPGGISLGMDCWIYDVIVFFVAQLGSVAINSHQILIIMIQFFYMCFPSAISIAGTIRISSLLTSKKVDSIIYCTRVCFFESFLFICISAILMYILSSYIGFIFTNNMDIINRIKDLIPFATSVQILYGLQATFQGILRATLNQTEILGYTFVSLWVINLPIGIYFAFYMEPSIGLEGLWVGLIVGLSLLSIALGTSILFLNWQEQCVKISLRVEKYLKNKYSNYPFSTGISEERVFQNPIKYNPFMYLNIGVPVSGSRSIGGFLIHKTISPQEEEEEFEQIENIINNNRESNSI
eukprot:gene12651-16961_t